MSLFDDLNQCLSGGPTILGQAPSIGTSHTQFHARLRSILFRDPNKADRIAPRIAQVYRQLFPNAPPAVARNCALSHLRLACTRRDLGPAPEPAWHQPEPALEPLGRVARRRRILASVRPILDAQRRQAAELQLADEAKREAARQELRAEYVHSRLNVPRRPKGGW